MSYYYCKDCDSFMDEIESICMIPEIHTELDNKPTEWITERRCLYCGSDNLEEAAECAECGEIFPVSMLDENDLCENCRGKEDLKYGC